MQQRFALGDLQGERTIVVGGAGFVGSRLVRVLLEHGASVTVVDNLLSSEFENLPIDPKLDFVEGSITDDAILTALPDDARFVFHLACYHGNQSSIHDPLADHENNTLTTLKLYERLRGLRSLEKVVYAAAGCAVAEKTDGPAAATEESDLVHIDHDSPYSISKIVGEFYSSYYYRQHGIPVVRARFQNVYGPGEVLGAGRWRGTPATVWRNVVPTFIYRALHGEALLLENDGHASRDFIFVDDVVSGLLSCALDGQAGEVFNLATGQETSILELAERINRLAENPTPVERRPAREWDRSIHRFGSPGKAKRELGFEAAIALEAGLKRTVEWTRGELPRIEACIEKHRHLLDS